MSILKEGQTVTVRVKNIMWPKRHLYAPGVITNEFNVYSGKVIYQKWFKPNEVGLTTGTPEFPFRVLQKENIVEVNDLPVDYNVSRNDRIEKIVKGSKGNTYTVVKEGNRITCSCPGFTFRHQCKHMTEVA